MKTTLTASIFIGQQVTINIDRRLGSQHPTHGFRYPVNYGFVPGTISPDGEELDAYVLGVEKPLDTFTGTCIAVIHRFNDADDKLIVVPQNTNLTDEEIKSMTHFQEQWFESEILRTAD